MRKQTAFLLFIWLGFIFSSCATQTPGDIVLRNGEIYTMEDAEPWVSAVVINGNKITAVLKDDAEADAYIGSETRVVDLGGKFALPGFIDGRARLPAAEIFSKHLSRVALSL